VARVPVDPVDREALKIAKDRVKAALAKAGFKVARGEEEPGGNIISREKLEELAEAAVVKYPDIREAARAIVAAKASAGLEILKEGAVG
jgi:phage head maturation protease